MTTLTKQSGYFDSRGHLSDLGVALCADAVCLGREHDLPESIRDHVEHCLPCKHEIVELQSSLPEGLAESSGSHPYFDRFTAKTTNAVKWTGIAASIALVLGIGFALFHKNQYDNSGVAEKSDRYHNENHPEIKNSFNEQEHQSDNKTHENQFVERMQKEGQLPEKGEKKNSDNLTAYMPSDILEGMIGSATRSTVISVFSPKIGDTLSFPFLFSWENGSEKTSHLKIINNRNKELYSFRPENSQLLFKDNLTRGLYYWKLESEDDLLYVGKFFVR